MSKFSSAAMGKKRSTEYVQRLSEDGNEMTVSFETRSDRDSPAKLVSYCIVYRTIINGRWHEIIRYDNAHGSSHAHVHAFSGKERRIKISDERSVSEIFNTMLDKVKAEYLAMKDRYLRN